MLGTDFKAGQTKFKTAVVEYIRALGMCPKVTIGLSLYMPKGPGVLCYCQQPLVWAAVVRYVCCVAIALSTKVKLRSH